MSDPIQPAAGRPVLSAVSTSVRQLCHLLSCIRFADKVQISITSDGITFSVEEARVMQGSIFLDKAMFTSFVYTPSAEDGEDSPPVFQVSLPALVETLNIFGASEASSKFSRSEEDEYASNIRPHRNDPFSNQTLGMTGVCRLAYAGIGEPFQIILEESGVTTTCNLVTYESEGIEEIPFDKQALEAKIILQARFLHDAITEISSMTALSAGPGSRLKVLASPRPPYFSLSSAGVLGSAAVEFTKSRELLETFSVAGRWVQYYKFDLIKQAQGAMKMASKVSFRGDSQGVLSLQFMVEAEGGAVSFVDFRFVPSIEDEGEEEDEETEDDEDYEESGNDEL